MQPMTLSDVARKFADEASAWEYVEKLRWQGCPVCPRCGSENVFYLAPVTGQPRKTSTGKNTHRRVWRCRACKRQFTVLIGTIFEGTKIPLSKWLMGIYLMSAGKNGVAALELQRDLGITYKSAWFMVHRIREAMANLGSGKFVGTIVADETWIGGNPRYKHGKHDEDAAPVVLTGARPNQKTDKTPVLSIVNVETGEVRSTVVTDVSGPTLRKVMTDQVDMANSHLMTDEAKAYKTFSGEWISHQSVNHSNGEYVRKGVSTNKAENFFSQMKRSLDGTHHGVSPEHLQRYATEFSFRYGHRKMTDGERATTMLVRGQGVRLSYQRLIEAGPVAMGTHPRPVGRPGPR
jgi:transposase-like protein